MDTQTKEERKREQHDKRVRDRRQREEEHEAERLKECAERKRLRDSTTAERKKAIVDLQRAWRTAREFHASVTEMGNALMQEDLSLQKVVLKDDTRTFDAS